MHEAVMPFYKNHVYPRLIDMLGDPPPIKEIRGRIVPTAEGNVLEIGAGSGANFAHYDPARVAKIYALEPNPGMIRRAEKQRRRTQIDIKFIDLTAEQIPLTDASIDTVVSTFTMCTIPDVAEALRGVGRVLDRAGGSSSSSTAGRPMLQCDAGRW
jgi:ubiquinone/menaquinone biosynthesis C-methylase UbiE